MIVVDTHPHIVSKDLEHYPITPLGGTRSEWSHKRSVDAEQLIKDMDTAGVDKAAVVHSSTTYGFNCDYVADAIAQYSDRLTGVFSVNVLEPDAREKMELWFARGCSGMRIYLQGSTIKEAWLSLDDPRIFPCYELAGEKEISVASNVKAKNFSELETVLNKFPNVNFILDHMGGVNFEDGPPYESAKPLWDLARYKNLYIKLVTGKFLDAHDGRSTPETKFNKIVEVFGADRCAWGSNYPSTKGSFSEIVAVAKEGLSSLSTEDQDWIMGKTALKLYPALS